MTIFECEKCDTVMILLMNTPMGKRLDKEYLLSRIKSESERKEDNIYLLDKLVQDGYIVKKASMGYAGYSLTSSGKSFILEGGYSGKLKAEKEKQEQERLLKEKTIQAHVASAEANKYAVRDRLIRNIGIAAGIIGVIIGITPFICTRIDNVQVEKK